MTETYSDLDQLDLSTQTYNALRRGGIHTCAQLLRIGRVEVRKLRWIGLGAEREIAAGLANIQADEWTERGAPLPELAPIAAHIVEALGLGDSAAIRQGLAKVTTIVLDEVARPGGVPEVRYAVADLEHGAR